MNKMQLTECLLISLVSLQVHADEGRFTVHAVDETGAAIIGAVVKGQFMLAGEPGAGWGDYKLNNVEGVTDNNGNCIITGKGDSSSASAGIFKEGYYVNTCGVSFTNSFSGRWQPWNQMVEVVLQKKGIQVPMYAKRVWDAQIPREGKPVGFDLMTGDWVAPDGKGQVVDMLFTFTRKTNGVVKEGPFNRPGNFLYKQLLDNSLKISFPGGGGIQSVGANRGGLRLFREAPINGYSPSLIKRDFDTASNMMGQNVAVRHSDFSPDVNYFFRIRAKSDDKGNITNTFYGKIYGDFDVAFGYGRIGFTYYLNPEPNSRNMEFNTKSNLFKDLSPLEQVTDP